MEYEMDALEKNGIWELVTPPRPHELIGSKWTYRYKFNGDGDITKHRARLVAQGFSQQPDINFTTPLLPDLNPPTSSLHLPLPRIRTSSKWTSSLLISMVTLTRRSSCDNPKASRSLGASPIQSTLRTQAGWPSVEQATQPVTP